MSRPGPFGRAIRDHHLGRRQEPLLQRDGADVLEHPIEAFYFGSFDPTESVNSWIASRLDGPLVDIGAGAGRHALYFQEQFETVAIDVSEPLVETMRDRGVEDARLGDMFALRETFEHDRFRSALVVGTQVGLASSMASLRRFLADLAFVSTADATIIVDCYDPDCDTVADLLGVRADATPGLAHRVMHFEYEGEVGRTLLFRLFSPDRLGTAGADAGWTLEDVERPEAAHPSYYLAVLSRA